MPKGALRNQVRERVMYQHRTQQKALVVAVAGGALVLTGAQALAQNGGGIQEVVVTAEKREESLQNTPISITALTGENLQKLGVTSFEGVARNSPSVSFTPYPSSSNTLVLYMRGQGVSDPMQITTDGSVGLYEDGFYISRPQASTFDLADIERVEVLRGPQGTLYGRNTTGGAVNLISKKPTGEFGFKQDFTVGTRNQFRSLTSINLPKWGEFSTKFTLLSSSIDGYVRNTGAAHDFGEQDQQAGRFSFDWQPFDYLAIDYFLEKGKLNSTPYYYNNEAWSGTVVHAAVPVFAGNYLYPTGGPQSRTFRPSELNESTSDFEAHGLTVSWDVSDAFTIKSLTGYRKLNWHAYQDYMESFASISIAANAVPQGFPTSFLTDDLVHDYQLSQEFQFIGNIDDRINYVSGLYFFKEAASHFEGINIGLAPQLGGFTTLKDRDVDSDAKSLAAYAQVTWTPPFLDDKLDITGGLRFTKDYRSAERNFVITAPELLLVEGSTNPNVITIHPEDGTKATGSANNQTFKRWNPALTVNYNWTTDLSTYAKVVTGYKAGGSSESGPVGSFDQTFGPEKVMTFELGLKSYWWDRRVRWNMALFHSKFDDMQLAFNVDPRDSSVVQSINAGKASVDGGELELLIMPIDDVTVNFEYSYLRPVFDTVKVPEGTAYDPAVNSASPFAVGENIKDYFVLPYAPRHSLSLGGDYTFFRFEKGDLSAHLNYRFQSRTFNTANAGPAVPRRDLVAQPSYGLWDGRLTFSTELPRGEHARISLWGKNILHKQYKMQVIGQGGFLPTPDVPFGLTSQAVIWNEPTMWGFDLNYEY